VTPDIAGLSAEQIGIGGVVIALVAALILWKIVKVALKVALFVAVAVVLAIGVGGYLKLGRVGLPIPAPSR
jgi:hypothetical protein